MKCKRTQRHLSDWIDNALSPAQAQAVEAHVASCPTCEAQRRQLVALKQLLALKRHEAPEPLFMRGMLDEFHRRLQAQESADRAVRWANWSNRYLVRGWERAGRVFASRPLLSLRYGLAAAVAAALALNVALFMFRAQKTTPSAATSAPQGPVPVAASAPHANGNSPTYVLDRLPVEGENDSVWF
jgi:anti-sigma factor RsiW